MYMYNKYGKLTTLPITYFECISHYHYDTLFTNCVSLRISHQPIYTQNINNITKFMLKNPNCPYIYLIVFKTF